MGVGRKNSHFDLSAAGIPSRHDPFFHMQIPKHVRLKGALGDRSAQDFSSARPVQWADDTSLLQFVH